MIGDDERRRVTVWGRVAFISGRCVQVLDQFEAFVERIRRSETKFGHLQMIGDDCDELKWLLEFSHNHIRPL